MKNAMEYKGYFGTVEYSPEDSVLFGKVIGIGSLISYEGSSIDELKSDFEAAVDDYLEMHSAQAIEPTYKGSFNVRISPELHQNLALFSAAHNQSLNTSVEEAIEQFLSTKMI